MTTGLTKANSQVVLLEEARDRLARVARVDEAKKIHDQAEAIRVYAKQQALGLETQNKAAEIKIRAERRGGELLAKIERTSGPPTKGEKSTRQREGLKTYSQTVKSAGLSEPTARRWQEVASIPAPLFEAHVLEAKASKAELTTAGTLAYAKEVKQDRHKSNGWHDPAKAPTTVTSRAIVWLQRVGMAIDGAGEAITDKERQTCRALIVRLRALLDSLEAKL
jgi:hypothetical protein